MAKGNNLGLFLGCIGGIVAMIGLAVFYEADFSSVARLGLILLVAAMFFAIGGAFSKTSQWTPKALTVFTFLTAGVVVAATLTDIFNVYFGAVEIVIAILVIVLCSLPATQATMVKN